jgi:HAD domain in Swiss Army Knife RNA repair proteins
MKVIFLDIDGVLNTPSTPRPTKESRTVDPVLLDRLNKLLQETNAVVVLTSTWRHEPSGLESARQLGVPFTDIVPDLRPRPRNAEIVAWLNAHPEVMRYVVIDDDDDRLDEFPLFQPSASEGLTTHIAEAAAAYLNGRLNRDLRKNFIVRLFQRMVAHMQGHHG